MDHGTASAGIVGAKGNNSIGVAGVAYDANVTAIHSYIGGTSKCRGQGGGTSNCDANGDSVLLARRLGNRIIVANVAGGGFTAEQVYPAVRAAIASAVANGIAVFVPANNEYGNNILTTDSLPTPDTGSVIVGALKHDGSSKMIGRNGLLFNHGKSVMGGTNNFFTNGGHGVDVSASGEGEYTTFYSTSYNHFGATSAATPTVGGIAALMLSVKPDLTPLEIRRTLRETQDNYNSDYYTNMPGMVNAYKAVTRYTSGGSSSGTIAGLEAKFYANTIFPPEVVLNELSKNASAQENNIPYYRRNINNIDFNTGTPDSFASGLKYWYMADIRGMINFSQTGNYSFALYHDDGAILKIDGNEVIKQKNTSDGFTYGNFNITTTGNHTIQLFRNQETGNANTALWWAPPGSGYQVVPSSAFSYTISTATGYNYFPKPKLVGRFFKTTTIPLDPVGNSTSNPLVSIGSKLYPNLDYLSGNYMYDQFGIGHTDNFAGYFSGFIKLPSDYNTGTYTFRVDHDDGATFSIDGQQKFSYPGPTGLTHHTATHYLQSGIYYPFVIQYFDSLYGAELKFSWTPPGGTQQTIPASAFYH